MKEANHTPTPKPKSTQNAKKERINLCVDLLRQGKKRTEILKHVRTCYNISAAQVDNYMREATEILDAERSEICEVLKTERLQREIEAAKLIPTPSELILNLLSELDLKKPIATGYDLKMINNEPTNVQRFASEAHRQFIYKILFAYSLEISKINTDTDTDTELLTSLSTDQLKRISEIIYS
jgi:hypothetical protein